MIGVLLDSMPVGGVLLTTIVVVLIATEIGYQMGYYRHNQPGFNLEDQAGSLTGAHLGLLAFILAFTFSMSGNHFDARKRVILNEANAIETAYLRAGLISSPEKEAIRGLLRRYVGLRSDTADDSRNATVIMQSEALHDQIWLQVEQMVVDEQITVLHSLLINALNEVFDIHEERVSAGMRNRIPASIWTALFAVLSFSMIGMGYSSGLKGSRSLVPSAALALSLSMVVYLIADLDRPQAGLMTADQSTLTELNEKLSATDR